jgi:hypothetical protein
MIAVCDITGSASQPSAYVRVESWLQSHCRDPGFSGWLLRAIAELFKMRQGLSLVAHMIDVSDDLAAVNRMTALVESYRSNK